MPRWKALPEELDPQVREFAGQLRRLVDRSGLSIAAVADRTGYSKTSWERCLNGRLPAPKGAILALAEVTGTNPVHLTTMWELAERAWSRAETRQGRTAEAIRISQARADLSDPGAAAGTDPAPAGHPIPHHPPPAAAPARTPARVPGPTPGQTRRTVVTFLAGAVGALLLVAAAVLLTDLGGDRGDRAATSGSGTTPAITPTTTPATTPPTSPSPSAPPQLPAGVECFGADCAGRDPETMGCGGRYATTVTSATVAPARVEVRYSKTCGAAWARITRAHLGDTVTVTVDGTTRDATVRTDDDAYTPMVPVTSGAEATACATLKSGKKGCTAAP
ncbi:XRE family transcriptional regulator [Streptomyces sp. TRM49041]|uniref:helix-turn-helix domain-containing protein n=1 Tax=Streptomyces sp. TRM49041 TaxID=2603216 RepID=UPI0011EF2FE7|nr:XRE family transcriptional regulator [Streptomyces sp. TRM49041]